MLPDKNRLKKKADFNAVYREGRLFYAGNFSLKVRKTGASFSRVGLSIGTKYSPLAVKRNRLKRQLREIIRSFSDKLMPGYDAVLMVKKTEEVVSYQEMTKLLQVLFRKAKLI